jgi:branched-chain amino acid aminotransferase
MEELKHYHNGEILLESEITYSVNDVGLLRGYGVFDFFRIEGTIPVFIEEHLDRFEHSANGLDLAIPIARDEIKRVVSDLVNINKLASGTIKIILTGGDSIDGFTPGKPNMTILNKPITYPSQLAYSEGAALMLHEYQREFPDVKSTNYLTALKLQKTWAADGFIDVLYHSEDRVWEVSRSSIYFFEGNKLVTNKEGVLKGITSTKVIEACNELFEIEVRPMGLKELMNAEEVFITSSTKFVMPIVRLGNHIIGDGKPGLKTAKVRDAYNELVKNYVAENLVS